MASKISISKANGVASQAAAINNGENNGEDGVKAMAKISEIINNETAK